jgi:hypothetical protein
MDDCGDLKKTALMFLQDVFILQLSQSCMATTRDCTLINSLIKQRVLITIVKKMVISL